MPGRNKEGPSRKSRGPQTGEGGGKGRYSNEKKETGRKTGGKKGNC